MTTYNQIRVLGKGTFGTVYLCERKHNKMKIVVKEMIVDADNAQLIVAQNEVLILKNLRHPNICQYYDSFRKDNKFNIVMEYARYGNLHEYIARRRAIRSFFRTIVAYNIFGQILMGVNHLHTKNIIHRDLKTENIFLSGRNRSLVKIGDFGISKILESGNQTANTVIGTTNYLAPEMCDGKPYNIKSDIWSLGCILYEICSLERLFEGSISEVVLAIKSGKRKTININKYGAELQEIIDVTIQVDPNLRPSAENLMAFPSIAPRVNIMTLDLGNIVNYLPVPPAMSPDFYINWKDNDPN